jgi:hypothetical protein
MKYLKITASVILFALLGGELFSQDFENVELVGRIYNQWGSAHDIAISGQYAFIAAGLSGLQIVDISDVNQPDVTGYFDDNAGWAYGVAVQDSIAFIADNSGLIIIDTQCNKVAVLGDYAYATGSRFHIIDISDPTNPEEVGSRNIYANNLDVLLGVAFLASDRGLYIIDVNDPTSPREIAFMETPGRATDVEAFWNYAYIADESRALRVIDVSNLPNPREVGTLETSVKTLTVAGNFAYLAGGLLRVIDISDPTNPQEVEQSENIGIADGIAKNRDHIFGVAMWGGLKIANIAEPESPEEAGSLNISGNVVDIAITDNIVCIADRWEGLKILDVNDASEPVEIGHLNNPDNAESVGWLSVYDSLVYLSKQSERLSIVSISDPSNPEEVGVCDSVGYVIDAAVYNQYAYLIDRRVFIRVISIGDPTEIPWRLALVVHQKIQQELRLTVIMHL